MAHDTSQTADVFDLTGRVAIITGGGGLLGQQHASAIADRGGIPIVVDINVDRPSLQPAELESRFGHQARAFQCDITDPVAVRNLGRRVLEEFGRVDILINNAANNPKMERSGDTEFTRFEHFPLEQWHNDFAVGVTGAFLCSQVFGTAMAQRGRGVILNIASDLAVIAPDQRLYRIELLPESQQPAKPVSYSIVKTALVGLTRYLATYWADKGVRVNAISPGGVYNGHSDEFVLRLSQLIPLGRMARTDEYRGAIVFLCSDAASYMTGANLVIDGGRTCW